jgi:hypothetical protein
MMPAPMSEMIELVDPNLVTLAKYPAGEWVYFTDENAPELTLARFNGFVESAIGPEGFRGPLYHRITERGRDYVRRQKGNR